MGPELQPTDSRCGEGQADQGIERRTEEGLGQPDGVEAEAVEVVDDGSELVDRDTARAADRYTDAYLHDRSVAHATPPAG